MKILKPLFTVSILMLVAILSPAQNSQTAVSKAVNAQNYVFVAQSASPLNAQEIGKVTEKMAGGTRSGIIQLSGDDYTLSVSADTVVAYLPYYGRAYQADPSNTAGGIKFTSTKFTYQRKKTKKGGWNISIKTQDQSDAYQLYLNIGANGYASLSVNSNSKQSISFDGLIKSKK